MSVHIALTGDERAALAGPSTLLRYLSPIVPTVVATARINQVSFSYPLVQLTVDTTSAGWANIREGMTVHVGSTSGSRDRGVYRVRKSGNSTTIYLQQMGSQDAGLLPVDIRVASFANNDYVTIFQRWDLWSVAPRINMISVENAEIFEDFDKAAGSSNTTPENIVTIAVNGHENHLADLITGDSLAVTVMAGTVKWPTSSGSTITHEWIVPDAFDDVAGETTNTLTANVPPGNHVLYYIQHDSIGEDTERVIHINVHHPTLNPPLLISEMPRSDSRDRTVRRMGFSLYNDALKNIADGSMAIYFEKCTWNGVDVPSAAKQMAGWVQREQRTGREGLRDATIDLVGPAGLLGLMNSTSQILTAVSSPSTWQECVPSLATASFMAFYMLRRRAANVLRLFNLTVTSMAAAGQRKPEWVIDKGSLLQQLQTLATQRGNFGSNSSGSLFFLRHPSLVNYDDRDALVERDELDASIYNSVTVTVERQRKTQQVRGEAFTWDGTAELPTALLSDSPKVAAQGSSQTKLPSQVVASQDELDQITGDEEARQNNQYPQIDFTILKNRDVYEPAEMQMVVFNVPDYLSPLDEDWTKRGIVLSVNKTHNPDGTSDIGLSLEGETHNLEGDDVPVPEGNDSIYTPPWSPTPLDPLPPPALGDWGVPAPTAVLPVNPISTAPSVMPGRGAIRNTASAAFCTYDIRPGSPTWVDRNIPVWFTDVSMMIHDEGKAHSRAAYLLGNNGTDSRVAYTVDVYETAPVWTLYDTVEGIYTIIESVRGIPGAIYIYGLIAGVSSPIVEVWTIQDSTAVLSFDALTGVYTVSVDDVSNVDDDYFIGLTALVEDSCITFNWISTDGYTLPGNGLSFSYAYENCSGSEVSQRGTVPGSLDGAEWQNYIFWRGHSPFTLVFTLTGAGAPVIPASRYSTNYGSSFGAERVVDSVFGNTGFDIGPRGITVLAGGNERVRTSKAGGEYENTVNGGAADTYPIAIYIPDYKIGSTSTPNKADPPDFYFATPAEVASHALWKVTLAGKVGITPSISGDKALTTLPMGIDGWRGKRLYYIAEVDGTRYLFRTSTTGTSWARTTMANANSVRVRRSSPNGFEALVAAGADGLKFTTNGGSSWATKTASGTNVFAQLFG